MKLLIVLACCLVLLEAVSDNELRMMRKISVAFFKFPFVLGPTAIIGIAALLTGPLGIISAEFSHSVHGLRHEEKLMMLIRRIRQEYNVLNNQIDFKFKHLLEFQDK